MTCYPGVDSNTLRAAGEEGGIASNIAGILRASMTETLRLRGWSINAIPSEGGLLISSPIQGSQAPIQFYYNVATRGWGFWRGVPMRCFESWEDAVMFGSADNRVFRMDVNIDNVLIDPPVANGQRG